MYCAVYEMYFHHFLWQMNDTECNNLYKRFLIGCVEANQLGITRYLKSNYPSFLYNEYRQHYETMRERLDTFTLNTGIQTRLLAAYEDINKAFSPMEHITLASELSDKQFLDDEECVVFTRIRFLYPLAKLTSKEKVGVKKDMKAHLDALGLKTVNIVELDLPNATK